MKVRTWPLGLVGGTIVGSFAWATVLFVPAFATGCGGGEAKLPANAPKNLRDILIRHEPCDEGGRGEMLDANNDGKAEVKKIVDGAGKEICRVSDVDFDGRVDMYTYFDASGQTRRIEIGFGNGQVSSIESYEAGKLTKRELATTTQNRIDTWDFFDASGKRVRRERDSNGDAKIDQWWSWDGDKLSIRIDRNDDGEPDADDLMAPSSPAALPPPNTPVNGMDASVAPTTPGSSAEVPVAGPSLSPSSNVDGGK